MFITLEGGEGAGKTTLIRKLAAWLGAINVPVVTTREPGGSPKAERIRDALLSGRAAALGSFAEAVLFSAARADHLRATIRPALERGAVVLCDRFADSTRAYQGALGNLDPALIRALEDVVVGEDRPDLTLILDLPARLGLARASARRNGEADRFEAEAEAFHEGLRAAFLDIAVREPERCVVIDAAVAPEETEAAARAAILARLGAKLPGIDAFGTMASS